MNKTNYPGTENLDAMANAKNYNLTIFNWVTEHKASNFQIAEIGAGKGEFANRFPKQSIDVVEIEKKFLPYLNQNTYTQVSDLQKKYDLIYSINVIEHIENDLETVKQISVLLKQGGTLKILVPARMELYSEMDKLVGHYRRYHKRELINLLQTVDLEVKECKYFDLLGYFFSLMYKILKQDGKVSVRSIKIYDKIIFPISHFLDKITGGKLIGKNLIIEAKKNHTL